MSIKGIPHRPLTAAQRKVWLLLSVDERPDYLRKLRQRQWVAARRKINPEKYRLSQLAYKAKRSAQGWYRKGMPWYRAPTSNPKRLAYFKNYNRTRRLAESREMYAPLA